MKYEKRRKIRKTASSLLFLFSLFVIFLLFFVFVLIVFLPFLPILRGSVAILLASIDEDLDILYCFRRINLLIRESVESFGEYFLETRVEAVESITRDRITEGSILQDVKLE